MPRGPRDRGSVAASVAVTVAVALLGGGAAVAATSALISQNGPQDPATTGRGTVNQGPEADVVVKYGQP